MPGLLDGDVILRLRCQLASNAFGRLREQQATQEDDTGASNVKCRMLRCTCSAVQEVDSTPKRGKRKEGGDAEDGEIANWRKERERVCVWKRVIQC